MDTVAVETKDILEALLASDTPVCTQLEEKIRDLVTSAVRSGYTLFNEQATLPSRRNLTQRELDHIKKAAAIEIAVGFCPPDRVTGVAVDQCVGAPARIVLGFDDWGTRLRPDRVLPFFRESLASTPVAPLVADVAPCWLHFETEDAVVSIRRDLGGRAAVDQADRVDGVAILVDFAELSGAAAAADCRDPAHFSYSSKCDDGVAGGHVEQADSSCSDAESLPPYSAEDTAAVPAGSGSGVSSAQGSDDVAEWAEDRVVRKPLTRAEEKELLGQLDTLARPAGEKYWWLIDAKWLRRWHTYVGHPDSFHPGPISNGRLLDDSGKPRKGLHKTRDYRGVNNAVWDFFVENHGGGPAIIREVIDIYSEAVDPDANSA